MGRLYKLRHLFVERFPSSLEDGVVYVSIEFGTAAHKCCCGCGDKVVTPITPIDWILSYDGQSISLSPSIGRSSSPCRSHYWLKNNRVVWCDDCTSPYIRRPLQEVSEQKESPARSNGHIGEPETKKKTKWRVRSVWEKLKRRNSRR